MEVFQAAAHSVYSSFVKDVFILSAALCCFPEFSVPSLFSLAVCQAQTFSFFFFCKYFKAALLP